MKSSKYNKVNVLMNIDNYRGEHRGRVGPILTCAIVSAIPFILYTMLFMAIIPLWIVVVFELLWTIRVALYTIGDENAKLDVYLNKQKSQEGDKRFGKYSKDLNKSYDSVYKKVKVSNCAEDGLIEYLNGTVAYILVGYLSTFSNNDVFAFEMSKFLTDLGTFDYDIYLFNVVKEDMLESDMADLKNYCDKDFVKERVKFLVHQDSVVCDSSTLYRYVFLVKSTRADWKLLREHVASIVKSYKGKLFHSLKVGDREEVSSVFSRDITAYVDLQEVLESKYVVEDFKGAKVLFYGDAVPQEYKPERDSIAISKRRVMYKGGINSDREK